MSKKVIYFPSLSTFAPNLKKDLPLVNDFSFRFYDKKKFGEFAHPYFLLTAGSLYKKKNIREDLGMQDALVFGDSGGFQIAMGTLKWNVNLRQSIFEWLERNSDLAMNIDIPPTDYLKKEGKGFKECLDMTIDNMHWFEKNQTGKTDFLNVLQLYTDDETQAWYDGVRGFNKFQGWGIGSANATVVNFCKVICMFLKNKEFEKPNFKWFHFLGKTSVEHFFLYAVLQKQLNKHFPHVQVTTDSSTPAMQAIFGNWYHSANYRDLAFVNLYFGNKGKTKYKEEAHLPCMFNCPMCKEITFKNFVTEDWHGKARFYISFHNLWTILKVMEDIDELTEAHFELIATSMGVDFYRILKSIKEMFESSNPQEIFDKWVTLYRKFDTSRKNKNSDSTNDDDVFGDIADKNAFERSITPKPTKEEVELARAIELQQILEEDKKDFFTKEELQDNV